MPGYTKGGKGKSASVYTRKKKSSGTTVAMRMMAKGTYYVGTPAWETGKNYALGTTYALYAFGGSATNDMFYQTLGGKVSFSSPSGATPFILAVIKNREGEQASDYDISDDDVLSALRTEGRLFFYQTGIVECYDPSAPQSKHKMWQWEWKNVKLDKGESLIPCLRVLVAAADFQVFKQQWFAWTEM